MRVVIMAWAVLPDTVLIIPLLAVMAEPLETEFAGSLIELAFREDRACLCREQLYSVRPCEPKPVMPKQMASVSPIK
jgi:hypothetical protein